MDEAAVELVMFEVTDEAVVAVEAVRFAAP
jgi:hypothetical protein